MGDDQATAQDLHCGLGSIPESGGAITLLPGDKGGRYTATCSPTEGSFFQRLTTGMCARIGDVVD